MEKMPQPQPQRIKKRRIFQCATHNGRKFVAHSMVLQTLSDVKFSQMRVGFTTTKKLGNAVIRNRIRRRLKEACRFVLPIEGVNGYNYVIIGRKAALDRNFELLIKDLKYLLCQFKNSLIEKPLSQNNETTLIENEAS